MLCTKYRTLLEPILSQLNPPNVHFFFSYSQNFVRSSRVPNLSKAPHRSHHHFTLPP